MKRAAIGVLLAVAAAIAAWSVHRQSDGRPSPPPPASGPAAGTSAHRKAIDRGLAWLASAQESDGRWSCARWGTCGGKSGLPGIPNHIDDALDPAVTGLAVLPFLFDGNTSTTGPHEAVVKGALTWLLFQAETYTQMGLPRYDRGESRMWHWGTVAEEYNPIVVYAALAEGLARAHEETLRPVVEAAVQQMTSLHRPDRPWAKTLSPYDIGPVVFWVEMLQAAEAAHVKVPAGAREEARAYLAELTDKGTGQIHSIDICPQ